MLFVLALALGLAGSAARASNMVAMAMDGTMVAQGADQSNPERCLDCVGGCTIAHCAQMVCGMVAAILPREIVLGGDAPAPFVMAFYPSEAGITRVTDPPPPRTFALG